MAEDLDDGEFWLPSQFLTEEDILTDFAGSSLTETDSDEEEFFAELTRRMSRSEKVAPKGLVLSGSPKSTLLPVGGSSRGSPTGPVSPPPTKEGHFKEDAIDLLNAAVGEVEKLKIRREENQQQQQPKGTGYFDSSRGFLLPPVKQQNFFSHHHYQQPIQFPQISTMSLSDNNRPLGLSPAAWPPLQRRMNMGPHHPAPPQNIPVTKRESVGTGVFLPRVDVNPNPVESRKSKGKNDSTGRNRGQNNGQKRSSENAQKSGSNTTTSSEIRLPSEWTY